MNKKTIKLMLVLLTLAQVTLFVVYLQEVKIGSFYFYFLLPFFILKMWMIIGTYKELKK